MKKILRYIFFLQLALAGLHGKAQLQSESAQFFLPCATDLVHSNLLNSDSAYRRQFEERGTELSKQIQNGNPPLPLAASGVVYTIPIVIHVVHLGEAVGTGTNLSNTVIQQAINGLNDRYRSLIGTGTDVEIQFCLATRDPNGNPTTGINRVSGTGITNYSSQGIIINGCTGTSNEVAVKNLSRWPNTDYYNIWVVTEVCNGAWGGFAYYPGASATVDGAVVAYNQFAYGDASFAHELGHGLNLWHTFSGDNNNTSCPPNANCNLDGDQICDTPPHKQGDCGSVNPCTTLGVWNNSRYNYMSYCYYSWPVPTSNWGRFTPNQITRMRTALTGSRASLLTSQGCITPVGCPTGGYCMSNTPVTTCSGTFYDAGGNSNYAFNESFVKTFTPATTGQMLRFTFTAFSTEPGWDVLKIYDGATTAATLIGQYSGTTSPGTVTATNAAGKLTFEWVSDISVVSTGWQATIACVAGPPSLQLNSTITYPNPLRQYCPFNGAVSVRNAGGSSWSGKLYIDLHDATGTFLGFIDSTGVVTIAANSTTTFTYAKPQILTGPQNVQLQVKYKTTGSTLRPLVSQGNFSNPRNAQIIAWDCQCYDYAITPTTNWQVHSASHLAEYERIYRVAVVSGRQYEFQTGCGNGGTANYDTFLELYDNTCTMVAFDDDACTTPIHTSRILWTANFTGNAHVNVRGFGPTDFGNYTLAYRYSSPCIPSTDPTSITPTQPTICAGTPTTLSVVGGSLGTGATWRWYTGGCGVNAAGTGASLTVSPTVTTTYYVRAEGTCGTTGCALVTVFVNAVSVAPTSANASPNPQCAGAQVTLTQVGGTLGGGAQWAWYSGSCGNNFIGYGSPTVTNNVQTTYFVRGEGTCGNTICRSVTVNVSGTPSVAANSASAIPATVCAGGTTTLGVIGGTLGTGATWQWYSGTCGGTVIGTGPSLTVTVNATTTYYVRAVGNCNNTSCVQVTVNVSGTMSTPPTSATATPAATCPGAATTLSVMGGSLGTGGSWQWYTGSCANTPAGQGAQISVSPSVTTTYFVRAEGACNMTSCVQVTVVVSGTNSMAPTGASASATTICLGQSTTLTAIGGQLGSGGVWRWYTGGCGVNGVGSGSSLTVQPTATTTYYVRAEGTCNTTGCASVTVVVNAPPAAAGNIAVPGISCQGMQQVFSINPVPGATGYTWSLPPGWTFIAGQGGTQVTVTVGTGAGQICVTPSNGCGNGPASCVAVTPILLVGAATVTGPANPCEGTTQTYTATALNASSFTWTIPASWTVVSGAGTATLTVTVGNTNGQVCATPANACGTGAQGCIPVAASLLPGLATLTGATNPCQGSTQTYTATSANALAFTWSVPLGSTILSGQGTAVISVAVGALSGQVCATPQNNCAAGQMVCQALTVSPLPGQALVTGPTSACTGSTQTFVATAAYASSYTWSLPNGWAFVSGQGTSQITVTVGALSGPVCALPANGCGNGLQGCLPITVNPLPLVTFSGLPQAACISAGPFAMQGNPSGGTFSGTGVSGNAFDPNISGAGTFAVTYAYTDANGCSNSATASILVNPLPVISFTGLPSVVCIDAVVANLVGNPTGGTFMGAGMSGNQFSALAAGAGSHVITYQFTDGNNCSNTTTQSILVNALPQVSFTGLLDSICLDGAQLLLTGNPAGGTFSGVGIVGNAFDPMAAGVGLHAVTYTYTDGNLCTNAQTQTIRVDSVPVVSFAGLPIHICLDAPIVQLVGSPSGGIFSGNGIVGSQFDPTLAGLGNHDVTYIFQDLHGCDAVQVQTVRVDSVPVVNYGPTPAHVCVDAPIVSLTGTPTGGFFSGPGVLGSLFQPSVAGLGNQLLIYVYTDGNQCDAADSAVIRVDSLPLVAMSGLPASACTNAAAITLTGTPAGGTFTGPGLIGNTFSPSVAGPGQHIVQYQFQDGNGCAAVDADTVQVLPTPQVTLVGLADSVCLDAQPITLSGNPSGGLYYGAGMAGNVFTASVAGVGSHVIAYGYQAPNGCVNGDTQTVVVRTPPPTPQILPAGPIVLCNGADTTLTATAGYAGYQWLLNGNLAGLAQQIVATQSGTYQVRGLDQFGCGALSPTTTIAASTVQALLFVVSSTPDSCRFIASPGAAYQWFWNGLLLTNNANAQIFTTPAGLFGNYTVQVTDANGCSALSSPNGCPIVGLPEETEVQGALQVYPNPTAGTITLEIHGTYMGALQVSLYDLLGQELWAQNAHKSAATFKTEIDLGALPAAPYFLLVRGKGWMETHKVVRE
jgi:PKD-like domain/Ig-like domain CHU_C associated/Pregnancy-associated plasma protein-A/Secretion system C-terminal sorting domain/CUB domain